MFTVLGIAGDEFEKSISGIILDYTTPRAYWENSDPTEGTPPTCFSNDSIISSDGKACCHCPYNDFGSKDGESNAKACKESVALILLRPENIMPIIVRIPVFSKLIFQRYLTRLIGKMIPKTTTKSVNYSYSPKINDIIEYCEFEDKLLSPNRIVYNKWKKDTPFIEKDSHEESAEDYFIKMMEYYYLESYKRVDFMLKYAINLKDIPEHEVEENDKYIWVLKRFCPKIACPKIGPENNIICTVRYHYYRPILFAEEKIIKDSFKRNIIEKTFIDLNFYQILRAYAYEAFMFYAQFESDDYKDIRNFLMSSYDL